MSDFDLTTLLKESIAACFKVPVEQIDAYIEHRRAQARRRIAASNARYDSALRHVTDVQACVVERLEQEGYVQNARLWQHRQTKNTALMLSKRCWDAAKNRLGTKLVMVYPDGSRSETFERSISLKKMY